MTSTAIALAAMLVVLGAAPAAAAHALLERATPAAGSTVHQSPREVVLEFSESIEPAFSTVRVDDAKGARVDDGRAHVDAAHASILEVSLPTLAPGRYHVSWRVVSVDTHVTEGSFAFDVRP